MRSNRLNTYSSNPYAPRNPKQSSIQNSRYNKKVINSPRILAKKYEPKYNQKICKIRKQTPFLQSEPNLITDSETLLDQKYHLLAQIEALQAENDQMNSEIQYYQEQIDAQNPKPPEKSEFQLKKQINELQNEYDQLCREFIEVNGQFNEKVLNNMQEIVDQQTGQLRELQRSVNKTRRGIKMTEDKFQDKDLQKRYENSWRMILTTDDLNEQLESFKNEEQELLNKQASIIDSKKNQTKQIDRLNCELKALVSTSYIKRQEINNMQKAHQIKMDRLRKSIPKERKRSFEKGKVKKQENDDGKSKYIFNTFMRFDQHKKIRRVTIEQNEEHNQTVNNENAKEENITSNTT